MKKLILKKINNAFGGSTIDYNIFKTLSPLNLSTLKKHLKTILSIFILIILLLACDSTSQNLERKYLKVVESSTNAKECQNLLLENGFSKIQEGIGRAKENNKVQFTEFYKKIEQGKQVIVKLRISFSLKTYFYSVAVFGENDNIKSYLENAEQ